MSDGSPTGTSGTYIILQVGQPRAITGVNTARALRPASTASAASVCAIARAAVAESMPRRWRVRLRELQVVLADQPGVVAHRCSFDASSRVTSVSREICNSASSASSVKYVVATWAASTVRTASAL